MVSEREAVERTAKRVVEQDNVSMDDALKTVKDACISCDPTYEQIVNDFSDYIPLGLFVVIKPDQIENKTKSGLILPETIKTGPIKTGKVLSISKKVTDVDVNDIVYYYKNAVNNSINGLDIVSEKDILAKC